MNLQTVQRRLYRFCYLKNFLKYKKVLAILKKCVIVVIEQIKNAVKGDVIMNISKFTQKSLQAVQDLEKTAYEFGNQEIEQEHLLYNLLHQDDSLILKMIEKMEIQKENYLKEKIKLQQFHTLLLQDIQLKV